MRGFFYAGSAWEYYERRLGLRECRDVHCVFCGEDAREYRVRFDGITPTAAPGTGICV